jgi:iron complex outermembrane receptor protein
MKSRLSLGVSALALLMAAQGAQAQTATDDGKLETVVVTATKQAMSLKDVPISLEAVTGKTLEDRGMKEFTDLQAMVPNLEIDQTNGNVALTIRGLGSGPGNFAFEQSVGLFVDGVYSSRARTLQVPFLDVERIEVVRGPQGALFGKNTNAGAISMITRAPTDYFEAEARAGGELAEGGYAFSGFVSGPLNDQFNARLSGEIGHNGPYIQNRLTGEDENAQSYQALRGQIAWKPVESFDALLKVEGFSNGFNGSTIMFNSMGPASCGFCNLVRAASGGANAQEWPDFWRTTKSLRPEFNTTKSGNTTLTANWRLGDWTITGITAYQIVSSRQAVNPIGGGLPFLFSDQLENSNQFSTEVRAQRHFENGVDVTAGLTYLKTKLKAEQIVTYNGSVLPFPFPTGVSDRPIDQNGYSLSPYLLVNYTPDERLFLSGSVRFSDEGKRARIQHIVTGVPGGPALPFGPTNLPYDLHGKIGAGLWDYSAKVRYALTPNASFYVSYATGTKAGGFVSNNSTLYYDILHNGATIDYKSENAKSWEVGGKFRFLDDSADLNIALFNTKFDNLQVSTFVLTTFLTGNAAKAHSRGVEIDGNWRINPNVTVGASGAYLDARYDDYPGGACLWNAPVTCTPKTNNLAGSVLLRAPTWKGSAYAQAQTPISDALRLSGRLSLDYSSRAYFQPNLAPLNSQPSFAKLDARIALSDIDDKWEVSLTGKNLTDKVTFGQAFDTPVVAGGSHTVVVGTPRLIRLEGVVRFF